MSTALYTLPLPMVTTGNELWKSNGTAAGTVLVKTSTAGTNTSNATFYLTNVNGILYFNAADATNGYELWKSDGTAAGTVLVKDIYSGTNNSSPANLTIIPTLPCSLQLLMSA